MVYLHIWNGLVKNICCKRIRKSWDEIEVEIKAIEEDKISLTTKFPETNPWNYVLDKYPVNSEVVGQGFRLTDFGAFIELEEGVDALLHVSQISRERHWKTRWCIKDCDEIEALVIDVNIEEKKISLSIRELEFRRRRYAKENGEDNFEEENTETNLDNEINE